MQNQCDGNANRNDCGRAVTLAILSMHPHWQHLIQENPLNSTGKRAEKNGIVLNFVQLNGFEAVQCTDKRNFHANTSKKLNMNSFLFNRFFPLHFIHFQIEPF